MEHKEHKGYWIVVEGMDGTGKSTQVEALATRLQALGFEVVTTKSPGQTEYGARIREWLIEQGTGNYPKLTAAEEYSLMLADRLLMLTEIVLPALRRGAIVLSDRYLPSSYQYQSIMAGLAVDVITKFHRHLNVANPDYYVFLDATARPEAVVDRIISRGRALTPHDQSVIKQPVYLADAYRRVMRTVATMFNTPTAYHRFDQVPEELTNEILQALTDATFFFLDSPMSPE